jgi:hypothetical protein
MKLIIKMGLTVSLILTAIQANAGTVVYYSFDTNTYVGASGTYQATTNAWQRTATLGSSLSSLTLELANSGTAVAGTALNENGTTAPLSTFSTSLSATNWTAGNYYQFTFDATLYTNVVVSYALQRSNTGPTNEIFQYSLNGGSTFTDFQTNAVPTAFGVFTNDLSLVSGVSADASVVFRIEGINVGGNAGTLRIDNFTIDATSIPEPSTVVLLGTGMLGLLVIRRRRY